MINIEIVYALKHRQHLISLAVPEGSSILSAIQLSGILNLFPEIDLNKQKVGIFSKSCQLTNLVQAGDRVEIYRPLIIDPKEARKARAKKSAARD